MSDNNFCWEGRLLTAYVAEMGNTIYEVIGENLPCSCGDNDCLEIQVVCNNNFCATLDEVIPYNDKKFYSFKVCLKSLKDDIAKNKIKLLSEDQAKIKRKQLLDNE